MEAKFFKCNHCGQIIMKIVDTGVPVICCGEPMEELVADTTDGALEKHVPDVKIDSNRVCVNVGEVDHPMIPEHYIMFIALQTDKGCQIHPLSPGDAPHADFAIGDEEICQKVYAYCNIHGLWVAEVEPLLPE